ncbi:LIM domain only protein 3-like isoform X1 [Crassostrea angulata]|uniref:LIM zinc-binding domain-containing protein n=2 Tax=Magallana TaxID=2171616 RepID=A0A8W8N699_MAGGI|nr:LIM domain only protein 3 isoform X1 [Crassostrea gigas]XP_052681277.1 LIM domain only protein 3-like isoform X1 [Crassostrea angulata]
MEDSGTVKKKSAPEELIIIVYEDGKNNGESEMCETTTVIIDTSNIKVEDGGLIHLEECPEDDESPVQISQEAVSMSTKQDCAGCKKAISDRFLLKALEQYWHEDCLKCSCCDCRLGEVGSTLFTKANLLLCRRDYLRLFGTTGYCSACSKMIPAFEMVMRAKSNVYHLECFACQQCNHRFCVGDKFYLCDNKILCEYDYEERMVFANMTCSYNALSQIKKQTQSLSDDLSSGYGSPSPNSL